MGHVSNWDMLIIGKKRTNLVKSAMDPGVIENYEFDVM